MRSMALEYAESNSRGSFFPVRVPLTQRSAENPRGLHPARQKTCRRNRTLMPEPSPDTDLTAEKGFSLWGERNLRFRIAAFKFLNHGLNSIGTGHAQQTSLSLNGATTATAACSPLPASLLTNSAVACWRFPRSSPSDSRIAAEALVLGYLPQYSHKHTDFPYA